MTFVKARGKTLMELKVNKMNLNLNFFDGKVGKSSKILVQERIFKELL
jgi:hypothetical protein